MLRENIQHAICTRRNLAASGLCPHPLPPPRPLLGQAGMPALRWPGGPPTLRLGLVPLAAFGLGYWRKAAVWCLESPVFATPPQAPSMDPTDQLAPTCCGAAAPCCVHGLGQCVLLLVVNEQSMKALAVLGKWDEVAEEVKGLLTAPGCSTGVARECATLWSYTKRGQVGR